MCSQAQHTDTISGSSQGIKDCLNVFKASAELVQIALDGVNDIQPFTEPIKQLKSLDLVTCSLMVTAKVADDLSGHVSTAPFKLKQKIHKSDIKVAPGKAYKKLTELAEGMMDSISAAEQTLESYSTLESSNTDSTDLTVHLAAQVANSVEQILSAYTRIQSVTSAKMDDFYRTQYIEPGLSWSMVDGMLDTLPASEDRAITEDVVGLHHSVIVHMQRTQTIGLPDCYLPLLDTVFRGQRRILREREQRETEHEEREQGESDEDTH